MVLFLNSCQTTHFYYVKGEDIKFEENYDIYIVDLKDSIVIKVEDPELSGHYYDRSDSSEFIFFNHIVKSTLELYPATVIKKVTDSVSVEKIKSVRIGIEKFNLQKTLLITGGILTGFALLILFMFLNIG
jgi:hypothetical protein